MKTPERRRSSVFIVNFEHISHIFFQVSIVDFEQVNVSKERSSQRFLRHYKSVARTPVNI